MIKIVTIIGARPQFVKAAVISRIFAINKGIQEVIIHTGQHFDQNMSHIFFEEMDIPKPDYNLNIHGLGHGAMTGQMLEKIEEILLCEKPDWVLVYGDTNSTLAGALAAKKMHIKVAHVEAGLRSYNMHMPEEINRILTDRMSDVLFCPTQVAVDNLYQEGFDKLEYKVYQVGDVMQDAALYYAAKDSVHLSGLPSDFVLCTVHREENTDNVYRLKQIFNALEKIACDIPVVLPLHPRTRKALERINFNFDYTSIRLIPPVGYLEMIALLKHCSMVMCDSGGLQKEAYFFEKPCVTLRDETEWKELIEKGYNILAGADTQKIIDCYKKLRTVDLHFNPGLYGFGDTGQKIFDILFNWRNE